MRAGGDVFDRGLWGECIYNNNTCERGRRGFLGWVGWDRVEVMRGGGEMIHSCCVDPKGEIFVLHLEFVA